MSLVDNLELTANQFKKWLQDPFHKKPKAVTLHDEKYYRAIPKYDELYQAMRKHGEEDKFLDVVRRHELGDTVARERGVTGGTHGLNHVARDFPITEEEYFYTELNKRGYDWTVLTPFHERKDAQPGSLAGYNSYITDILDDTNGKYFGHGGNPWSREELEKNIKQQGEYRWALDLAVALMGTMPTDAAAIIGEAASLLKRIGVKGGQVIGPKIVQFLKEGKVTVDAIRSATSEQLTALVNSEGKAAENLLSSKASWDKGTTEYLNGTAVKAANNAAGIPERTALQTLTDNVVDTAGKAVSFTKEELLALKEKGITDVRGYIANKRATVQAHGLWDALTEIDYGFYSGIDNYVGTSWKSRMYLKGGKGLKDSIEDRPNKIRKLTDGLPPMETDDDEYNARKRDRPGEEDGKETGIPTGQPDSNTTIRSGGSFDSNINLHRTGVVHFLREGDHVNFLHGD